MWFAFAYLLFFTIDILIVTDFLVFGMVPYNALVAAVSLYTAIMMRHMKPWLRTRGQVFVYFLWNGIMWIFPLEHLLYITFPHWGKFVMVDYFVILIKASNLLFFISGWLLLYLTWKLMKPLGSLSRWLMVSALGISINYTTILVLSPIPVLLYRYEGVLGYVMLFGWLMSILTIIRCKNDPEYAGLKTYGS